MKAALADGKSGDLIVVLYEKLEPLTAYLESVGAQSVKLEVSPETVCIQQKVINL